MASLIRLKQIESSSFLQEASGIGADFSGSVYTILSSSVVGVLPDGVVSGSSQLDGTIIKNLTLTPINSDGYSLIVSGAVAIVDATNLEDGGIGDIDSTVPAQLWINNVNGAVPPQDPSVNNEATADLIDQGEW